MGLADLCCCPRSLLRSPSVECGGDGGLTLLILFEKVLLHNKGYPRIGCSE